MHAVEEGRSGQVVDELMETLRYTPAVTGPINEEVPA
jgi:RNase P/RNase MRP subunit p29